MLDGATNRGPAVSVKGQGDRLVGNLPAPYLLYPGSHVTNQWPRGLDPVSAKVPETVEMSLMYRSPSHHTRNTGTSSEWECEHVYLSGLPFPAASVPLHGFSAGTGTSTSLIMDRIPYHLELERWGISLHSLG